MKSEKKKFLMLGSYLFSLLPFRGDLLSEIDKLGLEVYASAAEWDKDVVSELESKSITYLKVRLVRDSLNPLVDLLTFFSYLAIIYKIRPYIVFAYTIKPVVYGCIAAALLKVPVRVALISGLGSGFSDGSSALKRVFVKSLYKFALRGCHQVFFQNEADMNFFINESLIASEKCTRVMGSGVHIADYAADTYPPQITFTMISRLLVEKGVEEFLEAARRLKSQYPEVRFHLVGWIDDASKCISKEKLDYYVDSGFVIFKGKSSDVRSILADTSVFVLPSYYKEGIPRTLLEALAASRAIVTTNTPGCSDTVVDGWNGYLVPPKDVCSLAGALERFILDRSIINEMGARSKAYAESTFSVDLVNRLIISKMGIDSFL